MKAQHALPNTSGLPGKSIMMKGRKVKGMGRLQKGVGHGKKQRGLWL